MQESQLIPKDLTYASARNLQDLEKIENMELLESLEQEIQYLTANLESFKKIYIKEQKMKIYNDIQDDRMYKELNTQKTVSEEDPNQSIDNSSRMDVDRELETSELISQVKLEPGDQRNLHRIQNKIQGTKRRPSNRSMIFDEAETAGKACGRKNSSFIRRKPVVSIQERGGSQINRPRASTSLMNFRNVKHNFLMNSGLPPKIEMHSQVSREKLEEVQKKYIALNKRIDWEKRVRKKTKKPALSGLFNTQLEEFENEFVLTNIGIQKIKAENESILDEIRTSTEKINAVTQEINSKNVTKMDFTRRLSELNLSTFKLTN
jgi:hypothetical protein